MNKQCNKLVKRERKTAKSVNKEIITLYWWLGEHIINQQNTPRLGKIFCREAFPGFTKTISKCKVRFFSQNLWYMRQFYLEYKEKPNLQQLVGEISWNQNLLILSKVKDDNEKVYYLSAIKEQEWSREILREQINSQAYQRHCLSEKQNNFKSTLPQNLAEQAQQSMKDVYMFDMLGIT